MHGTSMGTIHLSRNLLMRTHMYIASIQGYEHSSTRYPESVNKEISDQTDVLPILCVVLIPSTVQTFNHIFHASLAYTAQLLALNQQQA